MVMSGSMRQRSRCRRDPGCYEQDGELSAVVELRRLFPRIADNENARLCTRSIAGWTPLSPPVPKVTRYPARIGPLVHQRDPARPVASL
jgi:hypothetical protein